MKRRKTKWPVATKLQYRNSADLGVRRVVKEPPIVRLLHLDDGAVLRFRLDLDAITVRRADREFTENGDPVYLLAGVRWDFNVVAPAFGDAPRTKQKRRRRL